MLFSDPDDWDRFEIVRCGVDTDVPVKSDQANTGSRLVYVGRLAVEKGLPVLLQSLRQLTDKGDDVTLTVVGDGPDREHLENQCETLGIADRTEFVGYAGPDEVVEYLKQSDVFILPSFAEGVPVTLMEAMYIGVPVISTYVGGIVELIENEKNGLLVSPSDSDGLRLAIERYLNDSTFKQDIVRNAHEKVITDYNLSVELDKLAGLFKR